MNIPARVSENITPSSSLRCPPTPPPIDEKVNEPRSTLQ